jgi:hypothetical protein
VTFPCISISVYRYRYVYVYIIITEIGSSLFFPFYLSPLLVMISKGLKFYIHSCIGNTSTIFTF